MGQLLISESYLKSKSVIDDNVDFKKLTPIIELVQDLYVMPALGSNLYDQIITQSTPGGTLTTPNKTLLDDHILKMMVQYISAEAILTGKWRIMNKGIMIMQDDKSNPIDNGEIKTFAAPFKNNAELYADRMRKFIIANIANYPDYFTGNGLDKEFPTNNAFTTDIFLEDCRPIYGLTNDVGDFRHRDKNGENHKKY